MPPRLGKTMRKLLEEAAGLRRPGLASEVERRFLHAFEEPSTQSDRIMQLLLLKSVEAAAFAVVDLVPPGRERDLALDNLEQGLHWALAGRRQRPSSSHTFERRADGEVSWVLREFHVERDAMVDGGRERFVPALREGESLEWHEGFATPTIVVEVADG